MLATQHGYDYSMSVAQHDVIPHFLPIRRSSAIGISMEQRVTGNGLKHLCSVDQTEQNFFDCMVSKEAERIKDKLQSLNTR